MLNHSFIIDHYTGEVTYEVEGLLEKSSETLGSDLSEALNSSNKQLCADRTSTRTSCSFIPTIRGARVQCHSRRVKDLQDLPKTKSKSVGKGFSGQMKELIGQLVNVHFVRCLKPNLQKKTDLFE